MRECLLQMLLAWLAGAARAVDPSVRPRCRSVNCTEPIPDSEIPYFTLYNSIPVSMDFEYNKVFVMQCGGSLAADDPALPALPLPRAAPVQRALVRGCRAPAAYRAALASLNVVVTQTLEVSLLPNNPSLTKDHLTGLAINSLNIGSIDPNVNVNVTDLYLDGLHLRELNLTSVTLSETALRMLPDTLEHLRVVAFDLTTESQSMLWLERLTSLRSLDLVGDSEGATPLTPPMLSRFPNLTELTLSVPLNLPQAWLNGSALTVLSLKKCRLTELPEDLFHGVNITELNLAENKLTGLPEAVFAEMRSLAMLDVSGNALSGAELWRAAARPPALAALRAGSNPLGAACPEDQGLPAPSALRELQLAETGARRVCAAWAAAPALWLADLSDNNITSLSYRELIMSGAQREVTLDLRSNPLRAIDVSLAHLDACRGEDTQHPNLKLVLTAMRCDCSNSLLVELLLACPARLTLAADPPCARSARPGPPVPAPRTLLAHRPDQLLCACPDAYNFSIPGCLCSERLIDNATVVQCSGVIAADARWPAGDGWRPLALLAPGAGLAAVPRTPLVELRAANNSIRELRADDIPSGLLVLDLRNNSISHISVEAARRLGSAGRGGAARTVWLAGNPLACECADRAAIEILKSFEVQAQLQDWKELRCSNGRELSALTPSELCPTPLVPTLLFAGLVVLILLIVAMSITRCARPQLKQFLFDKQLCLNWVLGAVDDADDWNKTKDVFISYAYEDREVAKTLIHRLEQRGHSTEEHSRDWAPGALVAEHIARSVLCARRTLLLVSDHYATSSWALQEFREAHAHALACGSARVIPVVCELSSPKVLPEELRVYLHNNTYLSWSDPDFWEKLWRVMPPLPAPVQAVQAVQAAAAKPFTVEQVPLQTRPATALAAC